MGKIKKTFLALHKKKKTKAVILEIPILFETNAHKSCDYTILIYVNEKEQLKRVLTRKHMDKQRIKEILSNQMPYKKKREMADFVINNSSTKKKTIQKMKKIMKKILSTNL